jgi:hypothetical protein
LEKLVYTDATLAQRVSQCSLRNVTAMPNERGLATSFWMTPDLMATVALAYELEAHVSKFSSYVLILETGKPTHLPDSYGDR